MPMLYVRVAVAMVAAVAAKAVVRAMVSPEMLHGEIHGVAAYLEVVGGLYSITVAFLIYVVWEQFIDNPFTGVWNVSYAPLVSATSRVA